MGRARAVQERCFAYQGILCRTCIDECPFEGEAIRPDADYRPIVTDRCVGCGICEHRCPADGSAIVIVPGSPP
jgi:Pyruvate/2-oxoacid:ferredoxin oxidoreductase delta subunit